MRVKLALISANHIFFANILFSLKNHVCTHLHRKKAKYVPRTFRNVLFGLSSDWHKKNLVSLCVVRIVCVQVVGIDCLRRYLYRLKGLRTFSIHFAGFFEFNEIRTKTNYSSIRELRMMCVTLN